MREQVTEPVKSRNARHLSPLLRLALIFGILVHGFGFLIFKIASNSLPTHEEEAAFIALVSEELEENASAFVEQASLFDSAPLFVPGEWSSAAQVFSHRSVQDRRSFSDFEPSIQIIDEIRPSSWALSRMTDIKQPSDLLALHFWDMFSYFGEKENRVEAYESNGGTVLVTILSGNEVYPSDYNLRMEVDLQTQEFAAQPVVYVLSLFAPGIPVGAPILTQSSGSDALDAEVLEWLLGPVTLARLPAGLLELHFYL